MCVCESAISRTYYTPKFQTRASAVHNIFIRQCAPTNRLFLIYTNTRTHKHTRTPVPDVYVRATMFVVTLTQFRGAVSGTRVHIAQAPENAGCGRMRLVLVQVPERRFGREWKRARERERELETLTKTEHRASKSRAQVSRLCVRCPRRNRVTIIEPAVIVIVARDGALEMHSIN